MTLAEKLALACRILAMQGHNDMIYGHVSALTDKPNEFWIKGSGIGLEEATEDDMVLIDFEGNTLAGKRKRHNEFPIHSEVYRTSPDISCVIHTHPTYSTIIASSGEAIWIRQSCGQNVCSRRNSVSTATNSLVERRWQAWVRASEELTIRMWAAV